MKSAYQEELVSLGYGTEIWISDLSPNFWLPGPTVTIACVYPGPWNENFSRNDDIGQKVVKFQRRIELYAINMVICGFSGKPKVFLSSFNLKSLKL